MAGIEWEVKPEIAWAELAGAQRAGVQDAIVDLAESMVEEMDAYLNALVPWHNGVPDDDTESEPKDLYSYVVNDPGQAVYIYMTHWEMAEPEPTLQDELAYVPVAIDYFGPVIMNKIRAMLK